MTLLHDRSERSDAAIDPEQPELKNERGLKPGKTVPDKFDILYFAGLFCLAVVVFLKCRYGFGTVDEVFFLSLGEKIYRGNAMLVHEWHASQFAIFLAQPVFFLFHLFRKSNEGIVLFFRYAYVIVQLGVCIFIYLRTRRFSKIGAGLSSWVFFLFCPLLQMNFNYNSLAIWCLSIALILILTSREGKEWSCYIPAGLFFAGAVLCCPYLVFLYVLYSVIYLVKKKRKEWAFFYLGCAILAVIFLAFILSRASVNEIISNFSHVLDDPEHPFFNPIEILIYYFMCIIGITPLFKIAIALELVMGLLFAYHPKCKEKKYIYLILSSVIVCGILLELAILNRSVAVNVYPLNYVMFPINILTPVCLVVRKEKITSRLFYTLWIPGMLYSLCIAFVSNLGIVSICSAASVATISSVLIVAITFEKTWKERTAKKAVYITLLALLMVIQLGAEVLFRWIAVYPGTPTFTQDRRITYGCEQGVLADETMSAYYDSALAFTSSIRNDPRYEKVTYITYHYWLFLEDWDAVSCSPSNLLTGLHAYKEDRPNTIVIDRLALYYSLNPDRIPDAVFVGAGYDDILQWYLDSFDFEQKDQDKHGTILVRKEN